VRRETIEAYRARYARVYRRRWGIDPPGRRIRRIAFVHDGPGNAEAPRLRSLLEARGAAVEEWWPGAIFAPPIDGEWQGLFLSAADSKDHEARSLLARLARRATEKGAIVAAAPQAVSYLAREGLLRGRMVACPPVAEEEIARLGAVPSRTSIAEDRGILTCSGPERIGDLILALLDVLHPPRREERVES
jgi:hypothetical protein